MYDYMMTCISKNNLHFHTKRGHVNNMCINVYQFHACRSQCSPPFLWPIAFSHCCRTRTAMKVFSWICQCSQILPSHIRREFVVPSMILPLLRIFWRWTRHPNRMGFAGRGMERMRSRSDQPKWTRASGTFGDCGIHQGGGWESWQMGTVSLRYCWNVTYCISSKSWSWHHTPCYTHWF